MNPKRILPILIILALAIAAGGWYYLNYIAVNDDGLLTASGTVEAIEVSVSPESGGKVAQVYVEEGQAVKKGDALLELDATLLTAQRDRALAALESAQAGYETAIAGDAEEALAYLDAHHPDLITLDIGLPDMRGDELAARIKSDIATRDIPILVISVYAEDPANMQFAAYALPKPIEQDALLDTVGSLLQGHAQGPVLIIESDGAISNQLADALHGLGHDAIVADSGAAGLARIAERRPGVILLDLHLPDEDGFMLLKRLKEDEVTADIPIIALATEPDENSRTRARVLALGASDIVSSPIDMDMLMQEIELFLAPKPD